MSHHHSKKEFEDALKIFAVDVYLGVPEAVEIADLIIHRADSGDPTAISFCEKLDEICRNTQFSDINGNRVTIGHCCASCAKGGPCEGS